MKTPLAAGVNQSIADQRLEHIHPARAFAALAQLVLPEIVETQLLPQYEAQPACSPLPRTPDADLIDSNLNCLTRQWWRRPVRRKQCKLPLFPALIENRNRIAPRRPLTVVDLAEI